jgi:hypothetical protein
MKRYNGHLGITYNTRTKKIEIDPSRLIYLLIAYRKISENARILIIKEIKQIARED